MTRSWTATCAGAMPVFIAVPDQVAKAPCVIVIHGIPVAGDFLHIPVCSGSAFTPGVSVVPCVGHIPGLSVLVVPRWYPKVKFTKRIVDSLAPRAAEYTEWDEALPGFGLRVRPTGVKSWIVLYRAGAGRAAPKRRLTLGSTGKVAPEAARKAALGILAAVAQGRDPAAERRKVEAAAGTTLRSVIENFLVRGAVDSAGRRLRTADTQRAIFARLVLPTLGARQVGEIKRSELTRLVETIADERGPRMATLALSYLGRVLSWHESREDDFRSPVTRGMARRGAVRRDRILSDDELRALWRAAEAWDHPYSRLVRFLLLTATRRNEATHMRWDEVDGATWSIPASRYKTKTDTTLPLSRASLDLLGTIPASGEHVFTVSGQRPLRDLSAYKVKIDARMQAEFGGAVGRWTLHDLRRTARSLMARVGVPSDHAERCLGHVISGVRGVYDRYLYLEEKRQAFEALADAIANVVALRRETK
jgi:integrase